MSGGGDKHDFKVLPILLAKLKSEYLQIKKAEGIMIRNRKKWFHSTEQWLNHQTTTIDYICAWEQRLSSPSRSAKAKEDYPGLCSCSVPSVAPDVNLLQDNDEFSASNLEDGAIAVRACPPTGVVGLYKESTFPLREPPSELSTISELDRGVDLGEALGPATPWTFGRIGDGDGRPGGSGGFAKLKVPSPRTPKIPCQLEAPTEPPLCLSVSATTGCASGLDEVRQRMNSNGSAHQSNGSLKLQTSRLKQHGSSVKSQSSSYLFELDAETHAKRISQAAAKVGNPFEKAQIRHSQMREPDPDKKPLYKVINRNSTISEIVNHPGFDTICAVVIIVNSILIGVDVQMEAKDEETGAASKLIGYSCTAFFLVELILRMWVQGKQYFTGTDNRTWNIFDFALVLIAVIDFIVDEVLQSFSLGSYGEAMKTVKMLRIIRLFRVFRFFRELAILALMILDSMKSLMWAMIMLTLIIYVFAIMFTQFVTSHLQTMEDTDDGLLTRYFGGIPHTVYSLIKSMLGGVSWGEILDPLIPIGPVPVFLFFFYIFFTILAVLNIITGVFVDNAVETARSQRDFLVQKEMDLREKYIGEMRDLFSEMDSDGSGTVNFEEIVQYFEDPRVQSYFQALGLDPKDTERLFKLIDDDGSGDVNVDEFLDGCLRLKGQARSIDVHAVMLECKHIMNQCVKLEHEFEFAIPVKGDSNGVVDMHLEVSNGVVANRSQQRAPQG